MRSRFPLFTVFGKEFLENLRDRRTLVSALLFGPLFGPLLFGLMVSRMLEQSVAESDEPLSSPYRAANTRRVSPAISRHRV
jgi:sodium transport system permease protein